MKVSFDTDLDRALADTRIWAALALRAEAKSGAEDPREVERRGPSVANQAQRRWIVSTDPDEHVECLKPYLALGFNHLLFHMPGDDQAHFIELYAKVILPRLRALDARQAAERVSAVPTRVGERSSS